MLIRIWDRDNVFLSDDEQFEIEKKDEVSTIRRKKLDFDPLEERIVWREHSPGGLEKYL